MTVADPSQTYKSLLNDQAQQGSLSALARKLRLGDFIRSMPVELRKQSPHTNVANPYALATVESIQLPDDAKAGVILRAVGKVGGGTPAELTIDGFTETAPAAGHIAISPSGDISTLIADAWTNLDVYYLPEKLDIYEMTLPVATGVFTVPAALVTQGLVLLLEAEATAVRAGGVPGKKIIMYPASALPATTHAAIKLDRSCVQFNDATDKVAQARVKFGVVPATDLNALLSTVSQDIQ